MKTLSKLLLFFFISVPLFFANAASDKYFIPDSAFRNALKAAYPSCFTSSDSLIKSSENTPPVGASFQNPEEIGEFNKDRNYFNDTINTDLISGGYKYKYYSFTIKDSTVFEYYGYNYWGAFSDIVLFDNEFKRFFPKVFVEQRAEFGVAFDHVLPPGKYYAIVNLYEDGRLTLGVNFSSNICKQILPIVDTTIISENAGACLNYSDTNKVNSTFYCSYGWLNDQFYHKITLDSARILKITTCGSVASFGALKVYDHLGNRINFINELKSPRQYCFTNPHFIRYLKAGTYYIHTTFLPRYGAYPPYGDFVLNVSTDGISCPINQKATFTKSISVGILDKNRTYFSDTKNNDPANEYTTVVSGVRTYVIYSFQLLKAGIVTIRTCNSKLSKTSVILTSSSYSSGSNEFPWYNCQDNNELNGPNCKINNGSLSHYLTAGKYYVLSGGHDNLYGNITTEISMDFNCPTCEKEETVILGMEDVEISDNISLSPNPSNGKTNLSLPVFTENISVTFSDLSGKILQRLVASNSVTEINTEDLSEGLYYVSFLYQNKSVIRKLVVNK